MGRGWGGAGGGGPEGGRARPRGIIGGGGGAPPPRLQSRRVHDPAPDSAPRVPTARRWVVLGIATALTAALDLGTKAWAFHALDARIVTVYEVERTDRPEAPPELWRAPGPPPEDSGFRVRREFPAVAPGDTTVTVIPRCFDLRCSVNTGAVFGILGGRTAWVMLLTCVALGCITWILWKADPRRLGLHVAFGLILGGALGNLWDRATYAGVRDFILWYLGDHSRAWPTFNIADAALCVGIGCIILLEMRQPAGAPTGAGAAAASAAKS